MSEVWQVTPHPETTEQWRARMEARSADNARHQALVEAAKRSQTPQALAKAARDAAKPKRPKPAELAPAPRRQGRTPSAEIAARNKEVIATYKRGLSLVEVAEAFNLSRSTIRGIITKAGASRTPGRNRNAGKIGANVTHGTIATYSRGCRCDPCVQGGRAWHREHYRKQRGVA